MEIKLETLKRLADELPNGSVKGEALMAYNNLKAFEMIADALAKPKLEQQYNPEETVKCGSRNICVPANEC